MNLTALTVDELKDLILYVSRNMIASKEQLTHADQAIGDGDHGIGMARGFEAVVSKIKDQTFSSYSEALKLVGMTLLASIGGAAGAVFGSFFLGAAKGSEGIAQFDGNAASRALWAGLEAVKKRGGAKVGDKTMIDALEPAAVISQQLCEEPLDVFFSQVYSASQEGVELTKTMIATTGKAKTLGERSLGYPDPGAVSMALIFQFMNEYIGNLSQKKG